jgi:hypothetical protein
VADNGAGQALPRRRASVFGVLLSLVFMLVAAAGFAGSPWLLFGLGAKWIFAAVVALVGVALLISAIPRRRRS